ncbi:MAG: hypothetical protein ABW032_06290, partial [Burkholderiaceae bacterium]
ARPARQAPPPHAGHGDALTPTSTDQAPPVYPTRAPPPATLRYALVEAGGHRTAAGSAELEWMHDGETFSLRLRTSAAGRAGREWRSVGGFDPAGIAPARLVERERERDKRAVNFDREAGRVSFSGASRSFALTPGVQDRWSWIAQLAAIVEAASTSHGGRPHRIAAGTIWQIRVAGLRGDLEPWEFRVQDDAALPEPAGPGHNEPSGSIERAPALLHLLREPERPYDLRIDVWLSPSRHHLPVGLRMSAPPGDWSLALWPTEGSGKDGS